VRWEWRNGLIWCGYDMLRDGYTLALHWNKRENLNDPPGEAELIYADNIGFSVWRGRWWPAYWSLRLNLIT